MKSMLYKAFFIFICCIFPFVILNGQTLKIEGTVIDKETEKGIEFANILLVTNDSVIQEIAFTDSIGHFIITATSSDYNLKIKMLGYKDYDIPLKHRNADMNLKQIVLESKVQNLKEVSVVAFEPIIKRENGKLIFNPKGIMFSQNNLLDIFKNTPGISVTNDVISFLGKSGVIIEINNRRLNLSGKNLSDILKTYSSNEIDKIEIINVPSAKYDAEGDVGIISVLLKKPHKDYYGGGVSLGCTVGAENQLSELNANYIYNKNKVSININGAAGFTDNVYLESNFIDFVKKRQNTNLSTRDKFKNFSIKTNFDYEVNKRTNIGLEFFLSNNTSNSLSSGESNIYSTSSNMDSLLLSENNKNMLSNLALINFYVEKKIDSVGKMIKFDVGCLTTLLNTDEYFNSNTLVGSKLIENSNFFFNDNNKKQLKSLSSSLDLLLPYSKYKIYLGAKVTLSENDNKITYINNKYSFLQNNRFNYQENIVATYFNYEKNILENLSIKTGVRLEYTQTSALEDSSKKVYNDYLKFFPTFSINYQLNNSHSFSISLNNRITRPGFRNINPFPLYINKYSIVLGKVDLKPYYTNTITLGYTYHNNFNIDAVFSYKKNQFSQITYIDSTNCTSITQWDNIMNRRMIGINNSYYFKKLSWMQVFFMQSLFYEISLSNSQVTIPRKEGLTYMIMINNYFLFNKKKTFTGWLSGSFNSTQINTATLVYPSYDASLGIQYGFLKNKLKASLSLNNLFSPAIEGIVNSNGMEMKFKNRYNFPTIGIKISYNFGNDISSKRRKSSVEEIQQRTF